MEEIFGYKFTDPSLLIRALTHPSSRNADNYQKLEFLGDRILSMVISEYVFHNFPNDKEGDLSKRQVALVKGETLAIIALEHDLGSLLVMSIGEEQSGGRENVTNLEDVLEALIAAIYLDANSFEVIREIILNIWRPYFHKIITPPKDPKSALQEILQAKKLPLPEYRVIAQTGKAHDPVFLMELEIEGYQSVRYEAKSKKKGEAILAEMMLKKLKRTDKSSKEKEE